MAFEQSADVDEWDESEDEIDVLKDDAALEDDDVVEDSQDEETDEMEDDIEVPTAGSVIDPSNSEPPSTNTDTETLSRLVTPAPRPIFILSSTDSPHLDRTFPVRQPGSKSSLIDYIDLTKDDSPEPESRDPLGPQDFPKPWAYTSAYALTEFDLLMDKSLLTHGNEAPLIAATWEEIYNLPSSLPMGDKVMMALWAGWIASNHSAFLSNRLEGVTSFVEEYGNMIYRAAGFKALRNFLSTMVRYRYLDFEQAETIIDRYYQKVDELKAQGVIK